MLRSLMTLGMEEISEDLTGALDNNSAQSEVIDEVVIVDPETSVDNAIIEAEEQETETEEIEEVVEQAEIARDALVEISDTLEDSIEDGGNGLKPNEAELVNVAVEHFRTVLFGSKKNNKPVLAIENFGTKMSKAQGTKLAIEGLNELVSEVDAQLAKTAVMRYSNIIKRIEKDTNIRSKLVNKANETDVKAKEFFGSGKYSPETNGRDLAVGSLYIHKLFNTSEAIEGKMPSAAILTAYETVKNVFGTNSYLEIVRELRTAVQGATNTGSIKQEDLRTTAVGLIAKFNNLFETPRKFKNEYSLNFSVVLPLSGSKLQVNSRILKEDDEWWYGSTSIDKEALPADLQPKLGALSNAEVDSLLTNITAGLQSGEFNVELAGLVEDTTKFNQFYENAEKTKNGSDVNSECCIENLLSSVVDGFLEYFGIIAKYEVSTLNALLDYINDSIFVHSSYNAPEAPAVDNTPTDNSGTEETPPADNSSEVPPEGENTPDDTTTPPEGENGSEGSTDTSEGTSETPPTGSEESTS